MNILSRRAFLIGTASAPLVYGLGELWAVRGDPEPAWIADALARMKESGRWGVVLAVPAAPQERFQFGQALWALAGLPNDGAEAHPIFCEAVFAVLTPAQMKVKFGVPETTRRVLLSSDGKVLRSDELQVDYKNPKDFAKSFRVFLHGENNERLTARAAEVERALPAEVREALGKLGSEDPDEVLASKLTLSRKVEQMIPVLAERAELSPVELVRKRASNLISSYFASLDSKALGAKVPYGATGPHYYDPCRTCGMAQIDVRSRMFLDFLVPGQKLPVRDE